MATTEAQRRANSNYRKRNVKTHTLILMTRIYMHGFVSKTIKRPTCETSSAKTCKLTIKMSSIEQL